MTEKEYIQVILPLKLSWEPWYSAPEGLHPGSRVKVVFAHRQYSGVVHRVCGTPDVPLSRISPILSVEEGLFSISESELRFWEFVSSYYLCSIGEVYKAAYPAGKIFSEGKDPRAMERLKERIARLDAQIAEREGKARCRGNVTEKLRQGREALLRQMESLKKDSSSPGSAGIARRTPGKPILLLGSERVERYRKAILDTQGDVLILTPDFIRSDELYSLLKDDFPDIIKTDSRQTAVQRRKAADSLRDGGVRHIVLGTRTSVFLPFADLGLVIVDEEQDSSYKQEDPAPRYNGRDCAVQLARLHSALIILGSLSPSLDSLYNVSAGRYILEECPSRQLADVEIIDVGAEARKNGMVGALSRKALKAASDWKGPVFLIRGWEKDEDIPASLPGASVVRYRQALEENLSEALVVVLQADALVKRDDFRADEKALQLVSSLSSRCARLIVQTAVRARFDGSRSTEDLLRERKEFGFPPYTRLVEFRDKGGEILKRVFLAKDSCLSANKARLYDNAKPWHIIDVDPL